MLELMMDAQNYTLNDIPERIIRNFNEMKKSRFNPLYNGILSLKLNLFILTGRWIGEKRGGETKSLFVKGNPIDILYKYMNEKDFLSENSYGQITNNWYDNRKLIPITKLDKIGKGDKGYINFNFEIEYKDGVIRPIPREFKIEEIGVSPFEHLKQKEGFLKETCKYLPTEEARNLTNYIFCTD